MIGEIKDVGTKKNYTVYTEKQIEISGTTGEILKENEIYVTKAKNRDDFIKFFVDHLSFIGSDLLNAERQVLFILLTKIDYKNIIYINSDLRRDIEALLKVSKSTVSVAINGLKKKGVVLSLLSRDFAYCLKFHQNHHICSLYCIFVLLLIFQNHILY